MSPSPSPSLLPSPLPFSHEGSREKMGLTVLCPLAVLTLGPTRPFRTWTASLTSLLSDLASSYAKLPARYSSTSASDQNSTCS